MEFSKKDGRKDTLSLKDLNSTQVCNDTLDGGVEDFAQIGSKP